MLNHFEIIFVSIFEIILLLHIFLHFFTRFHIESNILNAIHIRDVLVHNHYFLFIFFIFVIFIFFPFFKILWFIFEILAKLIKVRPVEFMILSFCFLAKIIVLLLKLISGRGNYRWVQIGIIFWWRGSRKYFLLSNIVI